MNYEFREFYPAMTEGHFAMYMNKKNGLLLFLVFLCILRDLRGEYLIF